MSIDIIARILGMILLAAAGFSLGSTLSEALNDIPFVSSSYFSIVTTFLGGGLGFIFTPRLTTEPLQRLRHIIQQLPMQQLFSAIVGLIIGLVAGALTAYPISLLPGPFGQILPLIVAAGFGYLGVMVTTTRPDLIQGIRTRVFPDECDDAESSPVLLSILLDTSVIIDGRIADICRTGFIQGELVVPLFVLNELQHIADSADTLRRNRGRRGLEILRQLQDEAPIPVRISDADVEGVREVDDKLINLARQLDGGILTNDYNLNRVAELQGVKVLNVNELANAVKTVLLPGERFTIHVLQEGKEFNQGVGYLDDGTMVVVEDGRDYIGQTLPVVVSKVLQTSAGRMIFARPEEEGEGH